MSRMVRLGLIAVGNSVGSPLERGQSTVYFLEMLGSNSEYPYLQLVGQNSAEASVPVISGRMQR